MFNLKMKIVTFFTHLSYPGLFCTSLKSPNKSHKTSLEHNHSSMDLEHFLHFLFCLHFNTPCPILHLKRSNTQSQQINVKVDDVRKREAREMERYLVSEDLEEDLERRRSSEKVYGSKCMYLVVHIQLPSTLNFPLVAMLL